MQNLEILSFFGHFHGSSRKSVSSGHIKPPAKLTGCVCDLYPPIIPMESNTYFAGVPVAEKKLRDTLLPITPCTGDTACV